MVASYRYIYIDIVAEWGESEVKESACLPGTWTVTIQHQQKQTDLLLSYFVLSSLLALGVHSFTPFSLFNPRQLFSRSLLTSCWKSETNGRCYTLTGNLLWFPERVVYTLRCFCYHVLSHYSSATVFLRNTTTSLYYLFVIHSLESMEALCHSWGIIFFFFFHYRKFTITLFSKSKSFFCIS